MECNNLINLDLSSLDVKNITNLSWIFDNCSNLKKNKSE